MFRWPPLRPLPVAPLVLSVDFLFSVYVCVVFLFILLSAPLSDFPPYFLAQHVFLLNIFFSLLLPLVAMLANT